MDLSLKGPASRWQYSDSQGTSALYGRLRGDSIAIIKPSSIGEVAEWSNVPDSKSGVGANLPWVRIPPSPPSCVNIVKPLSFAN